MNLSANVVRLHRLGGLEPIDCHIHRSTPSCIVASELTESLDLDGLCLVPTTTVRTFDRHFDRVDFYNAAVGVLVLTEGTGRLLGALSGDFLDDLRLLAQSRVMVAVHMESMDPDACFVGRLQVPGKSSVQLDRVTSQGTWLQEPLDVSVASITKVEAGTRYLLAMERAVARLPGA